MAPVPEIPDVGHTRRIRERGKLRDPDDQGQVTYEEVPRAFDCRKTVFGQDVIYGWYRRRQVGWRILPPYEAATLGMRICLEDGDQWLPKIPRCNTGPGIPGIYDCVRLKGVHYSDEGCHQGPVETRICQAGERHKVINIPHVSSAKSRTVLHLKNKAL